MDMVRVFLSSFVLITALLFGTFALPSIAESQEAAQKEEPKTVAQKCLACHGPYDKLIEKTTNFQTSSGETANPHQYVPHDEKKDMPECIECHMPHPVPLEDKSIVAKSSGVAWCYSNCHHASNLKPCKACH